MAYAGEASDGGIRRDDVLHALGWWLLLGLAGSWYIIQQQHLHAFFKISSMVLWVGLLAAYLGQMIPGWHERYLSQSPHRPLFFIFVPTFLFAVFLAYANVHRQLSALEILIGGLYLFVPVGLASEASRRPLNLTFWDVALILAIWFPIEFGWLPRISIPPQAGIGSLFHFYAIIMAIFLFRAVRPIPDMGLRVRLTSKEFLLGTTMAAIFMVLFALPIGMSTGFIGFGITSKSGFSLLAGILGTLFFTAFPEEILFRGIIQNMIERKLGDRPQTALILASIIFGISHANNHNPPCRGCTSFWPRLPAGFTGVPIRRPGILPPRRWFTDG